MKRSIVHVTFVVRDYDEAIEYFTKRLNFILVEDKPIPEQGKRWVVVSPTGVTGTSLVLARAVGPEQERVVGKQAGGRVAFFLETNNFWRDYNDMVSRGVRFVRAPSIEPYGTVAVFEDLYGNRWDLSGLTPA
jgi:catechol 2,3-dioxygenase-like lactoylglutathione lyase family enzyme